MFTLLKFVHLHCADVPPTCSFPSVPIDLGFDDRGRNCDGYDAEGLKREWEVAIVLAGGLWDDVRNDPIKMHQERGKGRGLVELGADKALKIRTCLRAMICGSSTKAGRLLVRSIQSP